MIKINFITGESLVIVGPISFIYEIYQKIYELTSNNHSIFIQGDEEELPLNTKFDENIHSVLFAIPNTEYNNKNICIELNIFTYDLELYLGAINSNIEKSYSIEFKHIYNGILYSDFISEYFGSYVDKSPYKLDNIKHIIKYKFDINNIIYTCIQRNSNKLVSDGSFESIFFNMKLDNKEIIKSFDYLNSYEKIYINIIELEKFISIQNYETLKELQLDKRFK
jgi:hypothetical protein